MVMNPLQLLFIILIPTLLFLGIVAACLLVLIRGLRLPRSIPQRAACGICQYQIDFNSPTCPECGSDLRVVGTLTARTALQTRSSLPIMLLAWSALVALVGAVAFSVWENLGTRVRPNQVSFTQNFSPQREPEWRASRDERTPPPNYSISLSGSTTGTQWQTCNMQIAPDSGPRVLVSLDMNASRWTMQADGGPQNGEEFSKEAVEQFLTAARIETKSTEIQEEIAQVANILTVLAAAGPDAASRQNWGIVSPDARLNRTAPAKQPATVTLHRHSLNSTQSSATGRYRSIANPTGDLGCDVDVKITFDTGENGEPTALKTLSVLVHAESGWPMQINCDVEAQQWSAARNEQLLGEGTLPMSKADVAPLLEALGFDSSATASDAIAVDISALANMSDGDLTGFLGWVPPVDFSPPTHGLTSVGGGLSSGPVSSTSLLMQWPALLIIGGGATLWAFGVWRITRRRRQLLALPVAAPPRL